MWAPFLGRLWCAARLFVRAASGRKRHNVLGALDAVTHRLIRVTNQGYIPSPIQYFLQCSMTANAHSDRGLNVSNGGHS